MQEVEGSIPFASTRWPYDNVDPGQRRVIRVPSCGQRDGARSNREDQIEPPTVRTRGGVESSCRRSDRISGDVTGYPVRHIGDAISGPSDVLLGRRTEDFEQDLAALHVSGQRFGDGAGRHSEWSASAGRPRAANHVRLAVSEIANRKVAAAITATVGVGIAAARARRESRDGCPCRAAGRDADWNADHECGGGDGCRLPNDARYDLSFAEPEAAEQREVASSSAHCCEEEVGDRGGRDGGERARRRARGYPPTRRRLSTSAERGLA